MSTQSGAGTGADARIEPPRTSTPDDRPVDVAALPPFAWRWVAPVAVALGALMLATSGRYGYQGDELYFLGAGAHPAWGYADNPPLMPWLAATLDALSGGSLVALRVPSALMAAGTALMIALTARELGGRGRAQLTAALAWAVTPLTMFAGHTLSASTVDILAWTTVVWVLVAWCRRRDDRLLVLAVVASAVAMQAKYSIVFLWAAVALAALVVGPRRLLGRPVLLIGGVVVAASLVPGLLWQAAHGWPQLEMTGVLAAEGYGPVSFFGTFVYFAGLLLVVLMAVGLWSLLRSPEYARYRFLGWSAVLLFVLFLVQDAPSRYVAGMFGLLWAVGAVRLQDRGGARWWRWTVSWPVFAVIGAISVVVHLPVLPAAQAIPAPGAPNNPQAAETVGWPELVAATRAAYDAVPEAQRPHTVIIAQYYTSAGALDHLGPAAGLPPVYSSHRGYWYFGAPPDDTTTALYVGTDPTAMRAIYNDVREVSRSAPGPATTADIPVYLGTGARQSWSAAWPTLRHLL
ncbi:glycosyltransferase family 39 protein [Paractinoplanes lichenicola]|uniref:Glycosyltransferase family 39 protein n=1 Tax=Paractinoplanes lichenicola TaxID=2802976 RepID=A0ABS1W0D0_9ACTN|nr:glycosyltransferase family 39 protein [Actinoplanes lichenicola]MBL7260169.1 glycosyltransferase family 39 protein [Actinoplanes lichenicola]